MELTGITLNGCTIGPYFSPDTFYSFVVDTAPIVSGNLPVVNLDAPLVDIAPIVSGNLPVVNLNAPLVDMPVFVGV